MVVPNTGGVKKHQQFSTSYRTTCTSTIYNLKQYYWRLIGSHVTNQMVSFVLTLSDPKLQY